MKDHHIPINPERVESVLAERHSAVTSAETTANLICGLTIPHSAFRIPQSMVAAVQTARTRHSAFSGGAATANRLRARRPLVTMHE